MISSNALSAKRMGIEVTHMEGLALDLDIRDWIPNMRK